MTPCMSFHICFLPNFDGPIETDLVSVPIKMSQQVALVSVAVFGYINNLFLFKMWFV